MATDDTTTEGEAPPDGTAERLDRLEDTQQEHGATLTRIEELLNKVLPGSHAEAQERTEKRLDRPDQIRALIQEEARAEVQRGKEAEAKKQAEDSRNAEHDQLRADVAKLREVPPAPPSLRRTRLLGWGDGRER